MFSPVTVNYNILNITYCVKIMMNQQAKHLGQKSFISRVKLRTQTDHGVKIIIKQESTDKYTPVRLLYLDHYGIQPYS